MEENLETQDTICHKLTLVKDMFMSPRVLITDKDRTFKAGTLSYGCLTNPNPYTKSKIAYKIA
jgi:hypothetical protein